MAKQVSISLGRTGGIIPDGVYKARITELELKDGAKAQYIALKLKIDGRSSTVFDNVTLAENARFRLEPFLDAIGAPTKGNLTFTGLAKLARNKLVFVKLTNEEYNGNLKNKVDSYLTAEVGERMIAEQAEVGDDDEDEEEDLDLDEEEQEEEDDDDGEADDDDDEEDDDDADEDDPKDGLPF